MLLTGNDVNDTAHDMEHFKSSNNFAFSGQRLETLSAVDKSVSVSGFKREFEKCMSQVVLACRNRLELII